MQRSARKSPRSQERGATLVLVLVMIVILGLSLGIAGSTWSVLRQRSQEQELFWRGDQIRRAIASYYQVKHRGRPAAFPSSLEDLVRDPRFPDVRRHLRRIYRDPMTGKEFELIREGSRILGVKSSHSATPFRQDGFPDEYASFAGAASYTSWEFVFVPPKNDPQGKVSEIERQEVPSKPDFGKE